MVPLDSRGLEGDFFVLPEDPSVDVIIAFEATWLSRASQSIQHVKALLVTIERRVGSAEDLT